MAAAKPPIGGGGLPSNVKKLTGPENYMTWKFNMRMVLLHEGLWKYVTGNDDEEDDEDWDDDLDGRALAKICLFVEEAAQINIPADVDTAKEAWEALKAAFETKGLGRKMWLQRHIMNVRLEDHSTLREYLDDILGTARQLKEIGAPLSDEYVGVIMLNNLGPRYESFVMAIENSGVDITSDLVRTRLLSHSVRTNEEESNSAFFAKRNKHSKATCYGCGDKGHIKPNCPNRTPNDNGERPEGSGNRTPHRTMFVMASGGPGDSNDSEKNHLENDESHGSQDSAMLVSMTVKNNAQSAWILDSGSSNHLSSRRDWFDYYNESKVNLTIADNSTMRSAGRGDITISVNDQSRTIEGALHVPACPANLLSVYKMAARGWRLVFSDTGCKIYHKDDFKVVGNAEMEARVDGGVYLLEAAQTVNMVTDSKISGEPSTNEDVQQKTEDQATQTPPSLYIEKAQTSTANSSYRLWHRRLGHLGKQSMKMLRDGLATGIVFDDSDVTNDCIPCAQGKMCRKPFPKQSNRAKPTEKLELILSDVSGPKEVPSWQGYVFYVTFTDAFTRKTFIYFMKNKSEVVAKFLQFKTLVENQTGNTIKRVRTDNGKEYVNNLLSQCLQANGIIHENTIPYNPEQNGIAERLNRTLSDKALCMLADAELSKKYWAEAISTAVYLKNRVPTRAIQGATPEELWTGIKPDLSHLKVFGIPCHVLVPKEKRRKLDFKTFSAIFIGYSETKKGYRVVDKKYPATVIESRDVAFYENGCVTISQYASEETSESEGDVDDIEETAAPVQESREETPEPTQPEPRRSSRERRPTNFGDDMLVYPVFQVQAQADGDPVTVQEAMARSDSLSWREAMQVEIGSLKENNVWQLVDRPAGQNIVKNKWVYKLKKAVDGQVKYKARLVAKGFTQRHGIDYFDTFSPSVRQSTIRLLFAIAAEKNLDVDHVDVTTAFLHGELHETVFMEQPEGFVQPGQESKVCLLQKAIYGLRQSSRVWYEKVDAVLVAAGYTKSEYEPCVYFKRDGESCTYIALYVDDFFLFSNSKQELKAIKEVLGGKFNIKDLGPVKECLGVRVTKEADGYRLDQERYAEEVLRRFSMQSCHAATTPLEAPLVPNDCTKLDHVCQPRQNYQEIVGSLMYLAMCTRIDLAYAISQLSQCNMCPTDEAWTAANRALKYLRGTSNFSLCFRRTGKPLTAYADSDWANSSDRKSTSGFILELAGAPISWESRKQRVVALSSTEAEYISISEACKEVVFTHNLFVELVPEVKPPVTIYNDNQSSHFLVNDDSRKRRTKHIDIRYHYVREVCQQGLIKVLYLSTDCMPADVLTKPLPRIKFDRCMKLIGVQGI